MKAAIVGYGRMGKLIRSLCIEEGIDVVSVIDPWSPSKDVTAIQIDEESMRGVDVAIDFSHPASAIENMVSYSRLSVPAVMGTTGWYSEIDSVRHLLSNPETRIIYSGNFSIGVAMFLHIVKYAGQLVNSVEGYDIAVREVHHAGKADCPSGTAEMIASRILEAVDRKKSILSGNPSGPIKPDQLQVSSERVGKEPGLHQVIIDSDADTITLEHHARSREGFARGAIRAAKWIIGKEPGLYTMDDFVSDLLGSID
ncbi:MAG: 4-hydroxy-tetrahydrodipicolinate reductase [Candidatus Ornithospirochaeta sp.]|nr:4-hydroxy-tetrahydrodipicolinate reductase [Candidatus Ornithospirochaeta sp.]